MTDEDRQNALARVLELSGMLHALRGLADEVEALLADALKLARDTGLSQAIIAEAAGLSRGRVNQVVKNGEASLTRRQLGDRAYEILGWPGDALRPHRASFSGHMTVPPYQRRRPSAGQ